MAQLIRSSSPEMVTLNHVLRMLEAFRAFDADNDGLINAAELGSEQDVKNMMQQGDTNRDGLLSIVEFLDLNANNLELGGLASCFKRAFEALDYEEDEFVTGDELHEVLGNVGACFSLDDCQAIIAAMDMDGDGAISFHELKSIFDTLV